MLSFSDDEDDAITAVNSSRGFGSASASKGHQKPSTRTMADLKINMKSYVSPLVLAAEFSKLEQTGSVLEYARKVDEYIDRLKWPSTMAIGAFRRGLKPYIEERLDKVPDLYKYSYAAVKTTALRLEQELPPTSGTSVQKVSLANDSSRPDGSLCKTVEFSDPLATRELVSSAGNGKLSELIVRQQKATGALMKLIPQDFKTTPGLKKPLLWHSAIKYIDSLTGRSHLTPFEVVPNLEPSSENKALTRTILLYMTPIEYQPDEDDIELADDPVLYTAESAANYIQDFLRHDQPFKLQKSAKKYLRDIQAQLRATLDAAVEERRTVQPVPQTKPTAVAAPAKASVPKVVNQVIAPTAPKPKQPPKPQAANRLAQARKAVKKAFFQEAPKGFRWGDERNVVAVADQKIRNMIANLEHLKAVIHEQESRARR